MARTKTTEGIVSILPRLVQTMKGKKNFQSHFVFYHWEKIVGRDIARHVRPVRMDFRTLFLHADAPAWAAQLRYMERELMDKINAFATAELVTSIRYTNSVKHKKIKKNLISNKQNVIPSVPNDEDREKAEKFCERIQDDEVRAAAERAFSKRSALLREQKKRMFHSCLMCGVLCPPEHDVCSVCERKRREEKREAIRHAIMKEPWLSYAELYQRFHCTAEAAMKERLEIARILARRVDAGDEESDDAKKIVMIASSLRAEELTKEMIHKVLSRMMYDMNYNEDFSKHKKMKRQEKKRYESRRYARRVKED